MRLAGDGHGDTASGALDADTESLPKVSRISSDNWMLVYNYNDIMDYYYSMDNPI